MAEIESIGPEFNIPEFNIPEFNIPEFNIPEFNINVRNNADDRLQTGLPGNFPGAIDRWPKVIDQASGQQQAGARPSAITAS